MYRVDVYSRVRHAFLVTNKSIRRIACAFGLNRRTVKKMIDRPIPSGYQRSRPPLKPKLDVYRSVIDEIYLLTKQHRGSNGTQPSGFSDVCKKSITMWRLHDCSGVRFPSSLVGARDVLSSHP